MTTNAKSITFFALRLGLALLISAVFALVPFIQGRFSVQTVPIGTPEVPAGPALIFFDARALLQWIARCMMIIAGVATLIAGIAISAWRKDEQKKAIAKRYLGTSLLVALIALVLMYSLEFRWRL